MNENGRKQDFLIEDVKSTDPRTGVEVTSDCSFKLWADADKKGIIESVEGVTNAYNTFTPTEFHVYCDKRYDMKSIQQEVIAALRG